MPDNSQNEKDAVKYFSNFILLKYIILVLMI